MSHQGVVEEIAYPSKARIVDWPEFEKIHREVVSNAKRIGTLPKMHEGLAKAGYENVLYRGVFVVMVESGVPRRLDNSGG